MFNSITGTITGKNIQSLFLEANGIEWDFMVSELDLEAFGHVGSSARVFAWLYHREDQMRLFGFASAAQRNLFLDLMKVDGIGPKQAIKILSSIPGAELEAALENEDLGALEHAPGIGKKTAQKMILALKGKLTSVSASSGSKKDPIGAHDDVVQALADMGFDRRQAAEIVDTVAKELAAASAIADSAKLAGSEREAFEKELFRRAIVGLSS